MISVVFKTMQCDFYVTNNCSGLLTCLKIYNQRTILNFLTTNTDLRCW